MIIGLPRYNNPDTYYSQSNNAVESILKKTGVKDWLESCGPTSAVMILDALGVDVKLMTQGGWEPQPEDILCLWFNDPRNYQALLMTRGDVDPNKIMGNRVPQYYERAIPEVYGVSARFYWGATQRDISMAIKNNRGVMVCLKHPSHYIAIVADDTDNQEFIYNDAWANNPWPRNMFGTSGFNRRVKYADLSDNLQPYRVEIG